MIVSILHGTQILNTRRTPATFHRQPIVAVALTHPISRKTTFEILMANDVGAQIRRLPQKRQELGHLVQQSQVQDARLQHHFPAVIVVMSGCTGDDDLERV